MISTTTRGTAATTASTARPSLWTRLWRYFAGIGETRARRELISQGYGYLLDDARIERRPGH